MFSLRSAAVSTRIRRGPFGHKTASKSIQQEKYVKRASLPLSLSLSLSHHKQRKRQEEPTSSNQANIV